MHPFNIHVFLLCHFYYPPFRQLVIAPNETPLIFLLDYLQLLEYRYYLLISFLLLRLEYSHIQPQFLHKELAYQDVFLYCYREPNQNHRYYSPYLDSMSHILLLNHVLISLILL